MGMRDETKIPAGKKTRGHEEKNVGYPGDFTMRRSPRLEFFLGKLHERFCMCASVATNKGKVGPKISYVKHTHMHTPNNITNNSYYSSSISCDYPAEKADYFSQTLEHARRTLFFPLSTNKVIIMHGG